MRRRNIAALAAFVLPLGTGLAQSAPLEIQRLRGNVVVDGVLNEAEWVGTTSLPLVLLTPVFKGTPTQRSEIRIAYDDENLYAAGWFYDTEASRIRLNSLYRDRWNGDDAMAMYIDTFNDNRNSKWFGITATGVRFDQLISDDGATVNGSWDTFWAAKTTVADSGWFLEVRIPFSSLGFTVDDQGRAVMGLMLTRLIARSDERVIFPEIDPKFDFRRPSVYQDIVLRDVRSRRPFYVTPYVLTGSSRKVVTETGGFRRDRNTAYEAGVDFRYPVSPRLTFDFTVNTDFAQVEVDDQQVNLDRFPLFFPERRRFFQEGSGIFDFTAGGNARLFHSRRIGLTRAGQALPVLGGARLVGSVGDWELGMLTMQTQELGTTPAENFGVMRIRRSIINPSSTAGVLATSYLGGDRRNLALGADAVIRTPGDHYLSMKWAGTADNMDVESPPVKDFSLFDLRWERRVSRGLAYSLTSTRVGKSHVPELGFLQRRDYSTANFLTNYYIFTDRNSFFRRVYPGALAFSTFRNGDRKLESGQYAFWVQWDTKAGGGGWVEPKWFREDVLVPFTIGRGITIPAGNYRFEDLQLVWIMPNGARVRTTADFRTGSYFDGTRTQLLLTPTWNASRFFELGGDYQVSLLDFASRNQHEDIHVVRLRMRTALDASKSGNAFVQYNSTTERLDLNLRLRYAIAEGTDLWIVYNEGVATEDVLLTTGAMLPRSMARAVTVKYTHTFGS